MGEQEALNEESDEYEDETASTEELQSNLNCSDLETSSGQNFEEMRELTPENQSGAVSGCEASAVNSEEEHDVEQEWFVAENCMRVIHGRSSTLCLILFVFCFC